MFTAMELLSTIYDYLGSRTTLRDLEDRLTPRLPLIFINPESEAASLAALIELGLAEISDDIRTERSFKMLLRRKLGKQYMTFARIGEDPKATGETATRTITESASLSVEDDPLRSWYTEPQVEYV